MNTLNEAIELAKAGKKVEARKLLESLLQTEPRNISAWLWYADTWSDDPQRIKALEQCLEYNPDNQKIHQALNVLRVRQDAASQTAPQTKSLPTEPTQPDGTALSPQKVTTQPADDTKICPYCAETIKAEAIVCRFCGRDLKTGLPPTVPAATATIEKPKQPSLLDPKVEALTKEGWQVINRTEAAAQLKEPKKWNQGGLILFVVLPILGGCIFPALFGVAIVGLILIVVDYMLRNEKTLYFTEEKLQQERQSQLLDEDHKRKEQEARDEQVLLKKQSEREKKKKLKEPSNKRLYLGMTSGRLTIVAIVGVLVFSVLIAGILLLPGRSSPAPQVIQATLAPAIPTVPVPKYTLMGTYKMGGTSAPAYAYYVVVDKGLDTNRTALRSIVDALCKKTTDCQVTFWDDISKAGSSPNYTDAQMNAWVAIYNRNPTGEELAICALHECD